MAIQSASEFEASLNSLINQLERILAERGPIPAVESALRDLERIKRVTRQPAQLKPMHPVLEKMIDTLSEHTQDANATAERIWDLMDYIEYWA